MHVRPSICLAGADLPVSMSHRPVATLNLDSSKWDHFVTKGLLLLLVLPSNISQVLLAHPLGVFVRTEMGYLVLGSSNGKTATLPLVQYQEGYAQGPDMLSLFFSSPREVCLGCTK